MFPYKCMLPCQRLTQQPFLISLAIRIILTMRVIVLTMAEWISPFCISYSSDVVLLNMKSVSCEKLHMKSIRLLLSVKSGFSSVLSLDSNLLTLAFDFSFYLLNV